MEIPTILQNGSNFVLQTIIDVLMAELENKIPVNSGYVRYKTSMGVAVIPSQALNCDTLFSHAYKSLQFSKSFENNTATLYSKELEQLFSEPFV